MVVDPMGQIIADAGDRECVLFAELQVAAVHELRAKLPFLRDMRRDLLPDYFPKQEQQHLIETF
jgi:predicted amidohydrolase